MPLSRVKIRSGYLIAFLLLLISYSLIFLIIRKQMNATNWVSHSYSVINNLEAIRAEITAAETGFRGYVITKDERFLEPYIMGSKKVPALFKELKDLTSDNNTYSTRIAHLGNLINRRLAYLSSGLELFNQNLAITPEMRANREPSKVAMDSVRILVSELQENEFELMRERNERLKGFFTGTEIITITSLAIAIITIIFSVMIYNREYAAKEKAIAEARSKSTELEQRVAELNNVNSELKELKSIEKFASTGRIARTIAHEVRNPLTNISLASEQLKEMTGQNEEAMMFHDMINRNSNRINQLVSDLLNSTRFAQLEYTRVDINAVLDEALVLAKDRIDLHAIKVEKNYDNALTEIYADREKIKFAFLNLIVNAIEAMEKGMGVLKVTTRKLDEKCSIEIGDNGAGMTEETIQKLFEPYFTSKMKGNGLGLTNTQNIILNHGGTIHVKSVPGQGSVFQVLLSIKGKPDQEL
ncbi:MAG: CHASE3 domain-containing protein [Chitinophagaceae bacterium]|nr:CHASE3 domain-containing protein [Chitinophagaceae bacterium]